MRESLCEEDTPAICEERHKARGSEWPCGRCTHPDKGQNFSTAERKGLKLEAMVWGPSWPAAW